MSHEIYRAESGQDDMAYTGAEPWHGLGQQLEPGADIETWKTAAGFNWQIERSPVMYTWTDENGERQAQVWDKRHVLYRSDNGNALSVMSNQYQLVQPSQVFDFFADICEEYSFELETAGMLQDGATYWALANTKFASKINGDSYKNYLMMATSCNGTMATTGSFSTIRTVCKNTLDYSLSMAKGDQVKCYHSKQFSPAQFKKALGLVDWESTIESFAAEMDQLSEVTVDLETAESFFANLLRTPEQQALAVAKAAAISEATGEDKEVRKIRGLENLLESYNDAPGAVPGSAYGLIQGVTHWVDHVRGGDDQAKNLNSAWFGQGASMKSLAMERARELVAA